MPRRTAVSRPALIAPAFAGLFPWSLDGRLGR